jgi:hypothetical protein
MVLRAGAASADVLDPERGDIVDVAARLKTWGGVVVGAATARRVEEWFRFDELGDLELKRKGESMSAYRVVGVRERRQPRKEVPLVGRERELAALTRAVDGLLHGHGVIVSISGEPGIGKSRLVAEVETILHGRVGFVTGHAVSYATTTPYSPVGEVLKD